jgi:hypothetical protein
VIALTLCNDVLIKYGCRQAARDQVRNRQRHKARDGDGEKMPTEIARLNSRSELLIQASEAHDTSQR